MGMDRKGKSKWFLVLILFVLVILVILLWKSLYLGNPEPTVGDKPKITTTNSSTTLSYGPNSTPSNEIRIASWNLQRFGQEKANNVSLMAYYVNKLDNYDIVVIQEVTDSTGEAFKKLCGSMTGYSCIESEREGTSSYKEQYGVFYKGVTLKDAVDREGTSEAKDFVRPPYSIDFNAGNWSFRLTTIHTDPDKVKTELKALETLLNADNYEGNEIIMGDLNADCSYYPNPPTDFKSWEWAIPDKEDTTVKQSNCAYDRIIINNEAETHFINYGVMRDVNADQSDHYLIYGLFKTDAN